MPDTSLKDHIALRALTDAPANGWSIEALRTAARACGQDERMADALFPEGVHDATRHALALFNRMSLHQLGRIQKDQLRTRERIATALFTRIDLMAPYREGLKEMLARETRPTRLGISAAGLWRSADSVWAWAGDTSTGYNHYSKRALLAGIMASALLFWLQDSSPGFCATRDFITRRIDTVLLIGSTLGKLLPFKKSEAA